MSPFRLGEKRKEEIKTLALQSELNTKAVEASDGWRGRTELCSDPGAPRFARKRRDKYVDCGP